MALRVVEIVVSTSCVDRVLEALDRDGLPQILETWTYPGSDDRSIVNVLMDAENTESITDAIASDCAGAEGFRMVLLPVEATLPRVEEPGRSEAVPATEVSPPQIGRVSREELYADVSDSAKLGRTFLTLTVLSALVAVIGLTRSSVAIIIGAMVIAPFLGPNVALALATALADLRLAARSLRVLSVGLLLAFAIAAVSGIVLRPEPSIPEIASRTSVSWGDFALAVASGAAGGLAYTTAAPTALVGVMVAVALLPPWVTFGMLLGAGHWAAATGALLLTVLNIVCLNLSGVLTFVLQGVRPAARREAKQARQWALIALVVWVALLCGLVAVLIIHRGI